MTAFIGFFESFISKENDTGPMDEELDLEEQQQTMFDISKLKEAIKVASEGALASKTVANYRRYLKCLWQLTNCYEVYRGVLRSLLEASIMSRQSGHSNNLMN